MYCVSGGFSRLFPFSSTCQRGIATVLDLIERIQGPDPRQTGRHEAALLRFGLVHLWAKEAKIGLDTINARPFNQIIDLVERAND